MAVSDTVLVLGPVSSLPVSFLEQHGLKLCRSTYMGFTSINTRYPWVSHPLVRPWVENYFLSVVGNPWVWRARCMHYYMRDLSIHGFWYLKGVLEPVPLKEWLGSQKRGEGGGASALKSCFVQRLTTLVPEQWSFPLWNFHWLIVGSMIPSTFTVCVEGLLRLGANYLCFFFPS